VAAPRIHMERDVLHIEDGHDDAIVEHLGQAFPDHQIWPDQNFFFGGVHGAAFEPGKISLPPPATRAGAAARPRPHCGSDARLAWGGAPRWSWAD
jgi:hypothetical protein